VQHPGDDAKVPAAVTRHGMVAFTADRSAGSNGHGAPTAPGTSPAGTRPDPNVPTTALESTGTGPTDAASSGEPQATGGRSGGSAAAATGGRTTNIGALDVRDRLPGTNEVPAAVARWVQDADADVARGRYESAMDLTLLAESLSPKFLPLYVRHAELLVATGRPQDAVHLAAIIGRLAEVRDDASFAFDLLRILAHAEPSIPRTVDLAHGALATNQPATMIDRYVPNAVALLVDQGAYDAARDLAVEWQAATPTDPRAAFTRVRELLRGGQLDAAVQASSPTRDQPLTLVAALAAQAAAELPDRWNTCARLARLTRGNPSVLTDLRQHLDEIAQVTATLSLRVYGAVIALAAGDAVAVRDELLGFIPADSVTGYVAAVCAARAASILGDTTAAANALRQAHAYLQDLAVAEFATHANLFERPADLFAIGQELAAALLEADDAAGAAGVFQQLLEASPGNAGIARAYAEALGRSGARDEAIGRLSALLEQQEKAHQRTAALETLQTMVRIAPGNLGYRSRMVERYIQGGRVGDAVSELYILAQLLERQGRVTDAVTQLQRAAEIAVLTGEWSKVDRIYRYMVRLLPDDLSARHAAAATYLQHGQIEQALEHLREVARISLANEDPDEAIAALHQIIALAPDDPEPYHRLGEVLSSIGEYGQAERVYRRLSVLLPDDPAVKAKQTALAALAQGHS